jgi:hypothetical protein
LRRAADGRLSGRRTAFRPDPDWVDDVVDKLVMSVGFDATLLHQIDPAKLLENRLWMKSILAYYGKIDPRTWAAEDLWEMKRYFDVIMEIIRRERSPLEG